MGSILIMSKQGKGVPIALKMSDQNVCKMYIKNKNDLLNGYKNPSVIGLPKMLDQYDIILFDESGMGGSAKQFADRGLCVMGGGTLNDSLCDKEYSEKVIGQLTGLMTLGGEVSGIELITEGWFDGKEFVSFNHSIEYDRLMEGGIGPKVLMGSIVWSGEKSKVIDELKLLTPLLERVGYLGPISLKCTCNELLCCFEELIPQFRNSCLSALSELMRESLFDYLWRVASRSGQPKMRDEYAMSVCMGLTPFSQFDAVTAACENKGLRVLSLNNGARKHLALSDVALNESGDEVFAGVNGVVGYVTARGETIQEVRRRAYRTLKTICQNKDVMFRHDIGAGVEYKIGKLKEWGWLDA